MRHTDTRPTAAAPDWTRLAERLRRLAVALTGDRARAEDLCQGTLVALLARAPGHVDHVGYARRTMLRLWMDEQRSLRRRVARMAKVARAAGTREAVRPEAGADRAEVLAAVRGAIDRLPARQKAALVMRLIEGLEYEQIAEAMGCTVGAVRANLHLAREGVRRQIGETP